MIESVSIHLAEVHRELVSEDYLKFETQQEGPFSTCQIEFKKNCQVAVLRVDFKLSEKPLFFRSSAYQWISPEDVDATANYHSPKLMKFANDFYLLGTTTLGAWKWNKKNNSLNWYLIHPDLNPVFRYNEDDYRVWKKQFEVIAGKKFSLGVFYGPGPVPEFARTPLGFAPTICFTDHCDYDTLDLLQAQRELFKKNHIRTTKGVFLHTYSHKGEYAALDQKPVLEEIKKWEKDGHEIAYHAFSRSFRKESWKEYQEFETPSGLKTIQTYIDHGFHQYNFSKQSFSSQKEWLQHMQIKGVRYFWNYVDGMEANSRSHNQLMPSHSSISAILQEKSSTKRAGLDYDKSRNKKTWLAYGTNDTLDKRVKVLNASFAEFRKGEKGVFPFAFSLFKTLSAAASLRLIEKNLFRPDKSFFFSRFSPAFFPVFFGQNEDLMAFQSFSLKDFRAVFCEKSLQDLEAESGVLVAHTYFAYLGSNHPGRIFKDEFGQIQEEVASSFERLGNRIKESRIWNPTLSELGDFHRKLMESNYTWKNGQLNTENFPGTVRWIK